MEGSTPKKWVLVVDDEPGIREMVQWYFSQRNLNVAVAENGADAVKKIKERDFSLVITDITMPQMDGLKLLETLKEKTPQTTVIIATGFGTVETAVYAMKKGAYDFILKPFDMGQLAKVLEGALALNGKQV